MVASIMVVESATLASILSSELSCSVLLYPEVERFLCADEGTPERNYGFLFDCLRNASIPTVPGDIDVAALATADDLVVSPSMIDDDDRTHVVGEQERER